MADPFGILAFRQAVRALAQRTAIRKDAFLDLEAAQRSRAFTMAWVDDLTMLQNIHDELAIAIENGETPAEFGRRLDELSERTGGTGQNAGSWHYRLVYDQNLGMAYTAGRLQQGSELGMRVWRYLPSTAHEPRADHQQYYGNLYRAEPGHPMPPIDFNCACGWEWVFPEELEAMGIDPESVPTFDPPVPASGFVWDPAAYAA